VKKKKKKRGCCVLLQVLERTVSIHSMKDGNMDECLLEEVVAYRQFTMQEIDLLATLTGMEVRHIQHTWHPQLLYIVVAALLCLGCRCDCSPLDAAWCAIRALHDVDCR
jgi:hypothetical protein